MDDNHVDGIVSYRPLIPFPDGSDSFVHGFEAGMVWQRMERDEAEISFMEMPCHLSNRELFQRMASARGYDLHIERVTHGEWMTGVLTKRRRAFSVIEGG